MSVSVVADYLMNNCIDLYDEIYNRGYADGFKIDKSEECNYFIDCILKMIKDWGYEKVPTDILLQRLMELKERGRI